MTRRVLLKLSGESLQNGEERGIDARALVSIAQEIAPACVGGLQLAIVIGGGNLWRGAKDGAGMIDRVTSDNMGMLATVINAMALQSALEQEGVSTRVQTAIEISRLAEPFIRRRAIRHLEKGRVVIFAAGTGNPFFTTDTAATLRAVEIKADIILKATNVDGVYDRDPVRYADAIMYDKISYTEVLTKNLKVMDATAISLCRDNGLPLSVFNLQKAGNIKRVICGENVGTMVGGFKP